MININIKNFLRLNIDWKWAKQVNSKKENYIRKVEKIIIEQDKRISKLEIKTNI